MSDDECSKKKHVVIDIADSFEESAVSDTVGVAGSAATTAPFILIGLVCR